jgi:pyruvate ferredoxin oxidoreductase alpha subunit
VDCYRLEDAEYVLVMIGSFATKARAAIDVLRGEGKRVGLVRPRLVRPWPAAEVAAALAGRKGVAVIDQNLSVGLGGILFQEVAGAVVGRADRPGVLRSFVGGLGGKDISLGEFRHVVAALEGPTAAGVVEGPVLLLTDAERSQVEALVGTAGGVMR